MRSRAQEYISNLSMDLIGHALEVVQRKAFPVYQKNIEQRTPPFAHGEFAPSAIAILLITSGLDYHLARLKYLRDIFRHKPPLPHTPYFFDWKIDDSLYTKIDRLLIRRTEKRLKEQLIELTIMRDSVAHPKLYFIRQLMRPDYSVTEQKAKLFGGASHKPKTLKRKLKRAERTAALRLPLVPTWISYPDIVVSILVLTRFLNLMEEKYGNPFAWVGGFSVRNDPAGFFHGWGDQTRRSISMGEWAQAFFDSLAPGDRENVQKRLGTEVDKYIRMRRAYPKVVTRLTMGKIAVAFRDPPKPEFLRKPPPWPIKP